MKKHLLLLLLPVLCLSLQAQNTYTDMPGRWRLGLNMGAIWETSDVSPIPGLGGGFNIEKILNRHVSPIGFSLGFRYLGGRTYGLNGNASYDIKDNTALNGVTDNGVRYDSIPGYFYANHKTFIQEGALELKMNFPRFEQRTHIIFHVWGGIGIGKFKTWIDAKNAQGNMYDFSSLGGKTVAQSQVSKVFDGSYETLADGSGRNGTIRPIPSFGAGLGFRLSPSVAFVVEHKVSLPLTDKLDGFTYAGACPNDFYHYTSVNLIFTFGTKSKASGSGNTQTNNTVYTTPTNTVVPNNNTNTTTPVITNTVPAAPTVYPPTVRITYPSNNFVSQYDNVSISAQLQHITNSQQIGIMLNGYPLTHFSYNPSNGMLNFQSFLALGNNYFTVTGTNQGGSASDNVNVIYNPQYNTAGTIITSTVNANPVITTNTVTVTNTNTVTTTVTPTVTTVYTNTVTTNNTTATVTPTGVLTPTVTISPTNTVSATGILTPTGTITTTQTITPVGTSTISPVHTPTTSPTVGTGTVSANTLVLPPVVQIYNPSVNPFEEVNSFYNVSASVLNINSPGQLAISVNGQPVTLFTYSNHNKMLGFNVQLTEGANTIVIKATNSAGTDSKSTVINHKLGKPPKVLINVPASSPYTTMNAGAHVAGFVYNVKTSADIQVTANGNSVGFSYNPADNSIGLNLTLQPETTLVTIKGTNEVGSDQQTVTLVYRQVENQGGISMNTTTLNIPNSNSSAGGGIHGNGPGGPGNTVGHSTPEITVLTPVTDPFYTNNSSVSVTANVNMVFNASDVSVSCNGAVVPASYDIYSKKLVFNAPLKSGMNTFVINASNTYGPASKQVNVNYTPVNTNLNVSPGGGGTKPNVIQPSNNGNNGGGGVVPKILTNPGKTNVPSNNGNQTNPKPVINPKPAINSQPNNTQPAPRSVAPVNTQPANNGGGGTGRGRAGGQ